MQSKTPSHQQISKQFKLIPESLNSQSPDESQKKLRLRNRTLRAKVLKILGEHIYIASNSVQYYQKRIQDIEMKEQKNKLSNYLTRINSPDFKNKKFTIQLSDKYVPNLKAQRMSLPQINIESNFNKVKFLCSFLTLDEALEVSEDPYYYICTEKFRQDEELLNYEAWGQIYHEVSHKLKTMNQPPKKQTLKTKTKSLNSSELKLYYCTELKNPEEIQLKIEKDLEEATHKKEQQTLQRQNDLKEINEQKFQNFYRNQSNEKFKQIIILDKIQKQIEQKSLKAISYLNELKESVEEKKILYEQKQINKKSASNLRLQQAREDDEIKKINILLKDLCKSRQVKADKQMYINQKKGKALLYQKLRAKQSDLFKKQPEKTEIDEFLSQSNHSNQ